MKHLSLQKNKAFSLIEILLTLLVILSFSVAIFFIYKKIEFENKSKFIVEQTNLFSAQGTDLYLKYKSNFDDFDPSTGKFPMSLFDTSLSKKEVSGYAGALAFPAGYYGSELIIYRREAGAQTPFDFAFHAKNMPSEMCVSVMSKLMNNKNLYYSLRLIRNGQESIIYTDNEYSDPISNSESIKEIANICSSSLDEYEEYNTYIGLTVR